MITTTRTIRIIRTCFATVPCSCYYEYYHQSYYSRTIRICYPTIPLTL